MEETRSGTAKAHQAIVDRYLWARRFTSYTHKVKDWHSKDGWKPSSSSEIPDLMKTALREAVIFEIPLGLFGSVYRAADIYTCTQVAGLEWYDPDESPAPPEKIRDEMPHYWSSVSKAGHHVPFPTKFPFKSVYFGLEPALPLKKNQREFFHCDAYPFASLFGFLITEEGRVWTLIMVADSTEPTETTTTSLHALQEYGYVKEKDERRWFAPLTLTPWVLPALLEWVNDHKVVSVEAVPRTLSYRRAFQRSPAGTKKLKKLVPPPYYAVTMRDQLVEEELGRRWPQPQNPIDWQHRWLVTGHDRIRVRRGPLPLDPKIEKDLLKPRSGGRRYHIFRDSHPMGDLAKELWRRGVKPKRDDEWMAVLVSRVKDYVKGPDDKPLIPSTRRSGRSRPFTP